MKALSEKWPAVKSVVKRELWADRKTRVKVVFIGAMLMGMTILKASMLIFGS